MWHFRSLFASVILLFSPESASAQNRWVVGPGGFPTIEAAYQAAAPGDVILVRVPRLQVFTLSGKGVSVIGDGLTPEVVERPGQHPGTFIYTCVIENVPAGQEMYLENLEIQGKLEVRGCDGGVVLNELVVRRDTWDTRLIGLLASQSRCVLVLDSHLGGCYDFTVPCGGGGRHLKAST